MDVNRVLLSGRIESEPKISHEIYGEAFFTTMIAVPRLSGAVDSLPIMLPGRLIRLVPEGGDIAVEGQLRSYRRLVNEGSRLQLVAYVKAIRPPVDNGTNEVELLGCLLRAPMVRQTPLGREIADLLISTDRAHGKRDCVPCIAWGRHAHACAGLEAGTRMRLIGRMQSRVYQKQLPDGHIEDRTTYEVSVGSVYEDQRENQQEM